MRFLFALLVMGFLILPAGCGGGVEEVSESDGGDVEAPPENATAEDLNKLMPPTEQ